VTAGEIISRSTKERTNVYCGQRRRVDKDFSITHSRVSPGSSL
jgi:hypothetical protein